MTKALNMSKDIHFSVDFAQWRRVGQPIVANAGPNPRVVSEVRNVHAEYERERYKPHCRSATRWRQDGCASLLPDRLVTKLLAEKVKRPDQHPVAAGDVCQRCERLSISA
jgi:hypothetical protein